MSVIANNTKVLKSRNKIHPLKFALWAACASIVMLFSGLTSAYIVRQSGGNWMEFPLPTIFTYSTIAIVLSSIALHASFIFFKKNNTTLYKGFLLAAVVLGFTFLVSQYYGWEELRTNGIFLETNPSSSFLYLITWVHAAHVLGGIVALLAGLFIAFSKEHAVTPLRKLRFDLTLNYWHFVDILWIYIFVFLILQQ